MLLRDDTELVAIIGKPVRPMPTVYAYNKCFEAYGSSLACMAFEVSSGRDAVAAMRALGLRGMAVTMPYKSAALVEADQISETARTIGACNTLYWQAGDIVAENTDALAMATVLERCPPDTLRRAVVIGSGGAARAAVSALASVGYRVVLLARNADTRQKMAAQFGSGVVISTSDAEEAFSEGYGVLVNATPVGWRENSSPVERRFLRSTATVVDFVFAPAPTRLLRDAVEAGSRTIDGLTILALQSVEQIRRWSGHIPNERDLRKWLEEAAHV